jgi:hypothetical protein
MSMACRIRAYSCELHQACVSCVEREHHVGGRMYDGRSGLCGAPHAKNVPCAYPRTSTQTWLDESTPLDGPLRLAAPPILDADSILLVQSQSPCSSRRRTSSLLSLTLLLHQHLLSQDLLDHPQVVRLSVDHVLQLLNVAC